nr:HAD-IA family hydrolase [Thiorhodospira sibirica]
MEQRLGIYKFAKIRVDSENEIRKLKQGNENHDNITLSEIYNLVQNKTNLNAKETETLEYQLELNYCFANPYFQEVISILKNNNKKMIVISDMYLSKEQISGILKTAGYEFFEDIFVSSEHNKSKKNGNIYESVNEKFQNKKIIHIGDNFLSDIENARKFGLDAYYYPNINEISSKTRISGMSYITGRVYSAVINNHLYNGPENYSDPYKLGFIYGGIYILKFPNSSI